MNRRTLLSSLIGASALVAVPAFADVGDRFLIAETNTPNPHGDVIDVAAATGQFTRFLALVELAGYEDTLRGDGPFTVFAPTDEAFRRANARDMERLQQPPAHDELVRLISYHVVHERLTRAAIGARVRHAESNSGYQLDLDGRDGLRVNGELVVMRDVEARNGVIQGVNALLSPPVLVASR